MGLLSRGTKPSLFLKHCPKDRQQCDISVKNDMLLLFHFPKKCTHHLKLDFASVVMERLICLKQNC